VATGELQRVFERFHRSSASQNNQGAGLGLAISKGFVEAMRGQVRAVSPVRDGHGFRVEFVFPLEVAMAPT
jgi:two-component system sensor histidine kinase KdpD